MQNGVKTLGPVVKYVGHKVSKVRWKPQPSGAIQSSDTFASASWEDEPNRVCIWQFSEDESAELVEPELVCECEVDSDVMDLSFLDEQRILASFSNGCVTLFRYRSMHKDLSKAQEWEGVHHFKSGRPAPCTAVGVCRGGGGAVSLVTGGEDGRITVIRLDSQKPLRVIDNADNATVTSLTCTMQMEVLSTSSSGQLKIWDLRSHDNKPTKTIVITSEYVGLSSLDRHPHQPHLAALGRSDGSICFLDLRQERAVQIVQAHSSDVWDVQFHPTSPNNLFSCSQDGSLWHWDASSSTTSTTMAAPPPSSLNPHLNNSHLLAPYPSSSTTTSSSTATSALSTTNTNTLLSQGPSSGLLSRTPLFTTNPTTSQQRSSSAITANGQPLLAGAQPMAVAGRLTEGLGTQHQSGSGGGVSTSTTSPWLSGAIQQGKVEIVNLIPDNRISVNSLDIESRHLVCGTDGEALFVIPNLTLT